MTPIPVKYFSGHTNIGILRVSRECHQMLLVSLFFLREINGTPCYISVRHVGGMYANGLTLTRRNDSSCCLGTILKAQRAAITYDLEALLRRQQQSGECGQWLINSLNQLQSPKTRHHRKYISERWCSFSKCSGGNNENRSMTRTKRSGRQTKHGIVLQI
jgi:hypothetical protein